MRSILKQLYMRRWNQFGAARICVSQILKIIYLFRRSDGAVGWSWWHNAASSADNRVPKNLIGFISPPTLCISWSNTLHVFGVLGLVSRYLANYSTIENIYQSLWACGPVWLTDYGWISLWLSFSNLMICSGKYMWLIEKMVFVGGLIVVIVFCELPTRSPVCIK